MSVRLPEGCDSIRGTARLLGCAHPTLIAALDDGRIPEAAVVRDADGRRIGLHVDRTRAAMAANTDPVQAARKGQTWAPPDELDLALPAAPGAAAPPDVEPGYHEARADRERAAAAIAQLQLGERLGQLVLADAVTRAATKASRSTRDALTSIPDRISALLAAETDPARVHAILSNELRQALNGLADRLPADAA